MRKKLITTLLVAAMTASMLAGCGQKEEQVNTSALLGLWLIAWLLF